MKTDLNFREVSSFIKVIRRRVVNFLRNLPNKVKQFITQFKKSSPHYGLRATMAFVLCIYFVYILKCFLTIPVRDYYFDVYANSPDSIVAQIDFTIGNKNVLNTYSSHEAVTTDECSIFYTSHKYISVFHKYNKSYFLSNDVKKLIYALDSIRCLSSHDSIYAKLINSYSSQMYNIANDTLFTYIYTHMYQNYASSDPVGMLTFSNFSRKQPYVYPRKYAGSQTMNKAPIWVHFIESPLLDSLFLPVFLDSTSYKKLSLNHRYVSSANIQYFPSLRSTQEKITYGNVDDMKIINSIALPKSQFVDRFRNHPTVLLLLSKEDISQVNYRFYFRSETINSYKVNIHNRGCAIINNNPSDELKVLSLHDTQIIKNKASYYDKTFYESEILASFPENNAIQYARLFFVTLIIGELIRVFLKNIWKAIIKKSSTKC